MSYTETLLEMEKTDRLLDLTEHPERYTDRELDAMLDDPELRRMLSVMGKTRAALTPVETPDVEAELAAFNRRHPRRPLLVRLLGRRPAVAAAAVVALSIAAVAAVVGVKSSLSRQPGETAGRPDTTAQTRQTDAAATVADPDSLTSQAMTMAGDVVVFDNATLENIVSEIAAYHGLTTDFRSSRARKLRLYFRWDRSMTADETVDLLNSFEQIKIKISDRTLTVN